MAWVRRTYRSRMEPEGLVGFRVRIGETNLQIFAERDISALARRLAREARGELVRYIRTDRTFLETLEPHTPHPGAPPLAVEMARAARAAGVGPMAAVAGAIAQRVGRALLEESSEVIVENGGDIFMRIGRTRRVAVFAGRSPLSWRVALEFRPGETPVGVACSSGTVGPSLSFGTADAAVAVARDAALADAVATGLGNRVRSRGDLERALEWALSIRGVRGGLVVLGDCLAVRGRLRLAPCGG